ncbi:glycosyltransferase family 2 protein, partial [uncultured Akkermansia sp.]|uniref:glycosyltransferase family 2 protein n=1 Tax=uncultured Akkermansia sp. TaxID=512294 RepID=UPI00265D5584
MKNNPPRFSIITINLNNREGLRKTILSVLEQKCRDFEYIVIDGASTDGSIDVIREYEHSITSWISEKDSGIYNAMNKGLARAGGEYIYFLNSGDFFYSPHVLSEIHGMDTVFDILCGRVMTTDGSIQKTSPLWGNQESFYFIIKNFCHQAAFMRTQLCKK